MTAPLVGARQYHLAQLNVARLRAPLDSPELADFVAALEPINALADGAPGFVWRLQTEAGDATAVRAFADERIIVNLSVWETVEALEAFAYRSGHAAVMRRRREWFEHHGEAHLALWWLPAGELPTVEQARERLERLRAEGASPEAFTLQERFPAPQAQAAPTGQRRAARPLNG